MIIAGKFEIPDSCPKNCKFRNDWKKFGQSAQCFRCPVLNCHLNEPAPEIGCTEPWRLTEPEEYRSDWAEAWCAFFKGEVDFPELYL